jgi:hypothetical protein
MCADSLTVAWTNWRQPQKGISRRYEEKFYPDIFNDFAARMEWVESGKGNTNPVVVVNGDKTLAPIILHAVAGQAIELDASASYDVDGDKLSFQWWIQLDIGNWPEMQLTHQGPKATLVLPAQCVSKEIHVICEVHDNGRIPLASYRRIIVNVN